MTKAVRRGIQEAPRSADTQGHCRPLPEPILDPAGVAKSGQHTFECLYGLAPRFQRHMAMIAGDTVILDVLLQDLYIRVWRNLHVLESMNSSHRQLAWMYRTATHLAIDALRARKRGHGKFSIASFSALERTSNGPSLNQSDDPLDQVPCSPLPGWGVCTPSVEEQVICRETAHEVLSTLRPTYARVIALASLGYHDWEIAEVLGAQGFPVGHTSHAAKMLRMRGQGATRRMQQRDQSRMH